MKTPLPEAAYIVALLSLPGCTQGVLARLFGLARASVGGPLVNASRPVGPSRPPSAVWDRIVTGRLQVTDQRLPASEWIRAAGSLDVERLWGEYARRGITVDLLGEEAYPAELELDDAAPYTLFRCGGHPTLSGRRVAIIGTRRATPVGREIAFEFGAALSEAGVRVISGLALGIDGAAHVGALHAGVAPPIGVVAGGFDLPYPVRHRALWRQIEAAGVLVSEWPLGTRSEGWRFPARNRMIARLAEVLLVVESRESGGSMLTVNMALERDITVMAVPGSVRNPAAAGTNKLLRDGATPACEPDDVLLALSMNPRSGAAPPPPPTHRDPGRSAVVDAVGWDPTPTSTVVARTRLDPAEVAAHLVLLELDGWVSGGDGWWQRIAKRSGPS